MKKYTFLRMAPRVIGIQFKASFGITTLNQILSILHAFTWVGGIVATQYLFDAVTNIVEHGTVEVAGPLILLAVVSIGQQLLSGVWNFIANSYLEGKDISYATALLHHKLSRIAPARFEDTSFLDDLGKAKEGIKAFPYFCNTVLQTLVFHLPYFILIGIYFYRLRPMLVFALLLSFAPAAPLRREYEYYQKTLNDREYYKETRLLGAFSFFHNLYIDTINLFAQKSWTAERKIGVLYLLLNVTTFVGMAISTLILFNATLILFNATMDGIVTVGAFAAVFAALSQMFNLMNEVVAQQLGSVNRNMAKVANFIRMLDEPEMVGVEGTHDFAKGVSGANISFAYPGRKEPSVKNVSLEVAAGETIAIVGENGAGKSTLVRLLTGIYSPTTGQVMVGGLDPSTTAPLSIFQGISGVFQKFQRYKMTLRDNVVISATHGEETAVNDDVIRFSLKEANVDLAERVDLDTMLSPEFDGIDLSGGQWQRVAIARGLYRTSDFIVLDEPTAAIDPIEEAKLYQQFQQLQQLARDKCAVIVTHRLGSAKLADRIIVMDAGEIVDSGTHAELMSRPGKYADMWSAQAQWYERA